MKIYWHKALTQPPFNIEIYSDSLPITNQTRKKKENPKQQNHVKNALSQIQFEPTALCFQNIIKMCINIGAKINIWPVCAQVYGVRTTDPTQPQNYRDDNINVNWLVFAVLSTY